MSTETTPLRVMMTKLGLDGHDRGVKIVARVLRDAGIDVIYAGLHRSPEEVVTAAIQEDVDVLGVSLLSGAHMPLFGKVLDLLKEKQAEHIIVVGGGLIPDDDVVKLKEMGVAEIMRQDSTPDQIVATIRGVVANRESA